MIMKAKNDHGIPLDTRIKRTFSRDSEHFLRLRNVSFHGKGKLKDSIAGGIAFAGKKLMSKRFIKVRTGNQLAGDHLMAFAPIRQICSKGWLKK